MGKTGKRNRSEEAEHIKKKIRKLEKKLQKRKNDEEEEGRRTPPGDPPGHTENPSHPSIQEILSCSEEEVQEEAQEEVPEEILLALGTEGADTLDKGEPIHKELASRWSNIMQKGLKKESRVEILNKYPTPNNCPTVAPMLNGEIKAIMSDASLKRDQRIVLKQNQMGKMLTAVGKVLTNIMKGNINTKEVVENLNNAAKIGADLFYQESMSRRYFALAGTTPLIREAIKNETPDDWLFGQNCAEKIKSVQALQRTSSQIRVQKKNFKSPLPQQSRPRSGLKPRNQQGKPHPSRPVQKKPLRKRSPPPKRRHYN